MKVNFQMLASLANKFFGILGFQIDTEKVFSLTSVLITLRHYYLQVQNLDQIISIINKWSDDLHLNCTLNVDLKDNVDLKNYMKAKICLA
jgi:hypothetical protein